MRHGAWKAYLAVSLSATGAYVVSPADTWLQTAWFVLIGLSSGAAILVGVLRYRPAGSAAWVLFAAGITLNATGTAVEAVIERLFHQEPFPSPADVFYFALYPALVAGLVLLIRRRSTGRDWATLVDATTISTGLGLLA